MGSAGDAAARFKLLKGVRIGTRSADRTRVLQSPGTGVSIVTEMLGGLSSGGRGKLNLRQRRALERAHPPDPVVSRSEGGH